MSASAISHLECSACGRRESAFRLAGLCPCGKPLLACYDLERASRTLRPGGLSGRPSSLWRYAEVLPDAGPAGEITLGEGGTPLLAVPALARRAGVRALWVKEEGSNPTGSFKARGMAVAVPMAKRLGATAVAAPSAGNAGSALAAYAARVGLPAHVFMPDDVPEIFVRECEALGAAVVLVPGRITDAGREMAARREREGWFDVSTLKEPYRVEGKKTMAYEILEELAGEVPDVFVYPTGGGTGIVGMARAFEEMRALGWLDAPPPRLVCVQAAGCAPIVRAFREGASRAEPWERAETHALGLRVPSAIGDFLILRAIRETGGTAVAVEEEEIRSARAELSRATGVYACPEGAATWAALLRLRASGDVSPDDRVVLFQTGTGLKYPEIPVPERPA